MKNETSDVETLPPQGARAVKLGQLALRVKADVMCCLRHHTMQVCIPLQDNPNMSDPMRNSKVQGLSVRWLTPLLQRPSLYASLQRPIGLISCNGHSDEGVP